MKQAFANPTIGKELESKFMQTSDMLKRDYLCVLLAVIIFVFVVHQNRKAYRKKTTYPNVKKVRLTKGTAILAASLEHRTGHVSMCGGRGRSLTFRLRVITNLDALPPRNGIKGVFTGRLSLQDNVRLACQSRPASSLGVRAEVDAPIESLTT